MIYFTVVVAYKQGIVRKLVVPSDLRAVDFARAAGRLGRIARMTFEEGSFDRQHAAHLAYAEGAIVLNMRGEREEVAHA